MYDLPRPMESCKKLVLDFDPITKKELVTVHPGLVKFLKPHQVRFTCFKKIIFLFIYIFIDFEKMYNPV